MYRPFLFQMLVEGVRSEKDREILQLLASYIPADKQEAMDLWDAWESRTQDDDWWIRAMAWMYLFLLNATYQLGPIEPYLEKALQSEQNRIVCKVLSAYPLKSPEELIKLLEYVKEYSDFLEKIRSEKDREILQSLASYVPADKQEAMDLWDAWESRTQDDDWWIRAMAWMYLFLLNATYQLGPIEPYLEKALQSEQNGVVREVLSAYPLKSPEELIRLLEYVKKNRENFTTLVKAIRSNREIIRGLIRYVPMDKGEAKELWDAWKYRTEDDDWWIRAMAWMYLFLLNATYQLGPIEPYLEKALQSEQNGVVREVLSAYPLKGPEELAKLLEYVEEHREFGL